MKFKPMLSATLPVDYLSAGGNGEMHLRRKQLRYPLLGSFKFDGIRAEIQNGRVFSRNLKLIPNKHVQLLFGRPELEGLDGELIVGDPRESDIVFRRTESAVMSRAGTPAVCFYTFDCFDVRLVFTRRMQMAGKLVRRARRPLPHYPFNAGNSAVVQSCLQVVEQVPLNNEDELLAFERIALRAGYEGIMLRDPFGMYKQGRSTLREGGLLKLKRFKDGEAQLIGVEEQMHNDNEKRRDGKRSTHKAGMIPMDTLGAFIVRDLKTGAKFNVGSGLSQEEKQHYWKIRSALARSKPIVKFKFFPTGSKDKPRFPVFIGFRDKRDV